MASSTKLKLKLMVHKKAKNVIFAESDSDFVDILFSFLTMPIGKVIHLLGGKTCIGSMEMLHESVKSLDEKYFSTEACKSMLLNPLNSSRSHYNDLILRVDSKNPGRYYMCKKGECATELYPFYSSSPNAKCGCGEFMTLSREFEDEDWKDGADGDGIFVEGNNTYLISDDLNVMPSSFIAIQDTLDKFKIKDLDDIEESYIDLDDYLVLDLLKKSLISKSPLSGLYFQQPIPTADFEFVSDSLPKLEMGSTDNSKSLKAKLIVCKSSKDVVYAESKGEELTDLLLSFLTYPLGAIVKLLNKCSNLGCLDNLYQSADADFVKSEIKSTLLNPELAPFFGCDASLCLIDELSARSAPLTGCSICHTDDVCAEDECEHEVKHISVSEINPKLSSPSEDCGGGYAKKGVKFTITDNLILSPSSPSTVMQTIKKSKFCVADLEEKEIEIGENEALNLLKACLTSTNPLNDVFGTKQKKLHAACK